MIMINDKWCCQNILDLDLDGERRMRNQINIDIESDIKNIFSEIIFPIPHNKWNTQKVFV